jgi:TPP-dependent pyruvate/acetoin dehydrogenase alpha subunit/pyruvate/2-oxoglutarate/acetoin dehydrogenase E1 component
VIASIKSQSQHLTPTILDTPDIDLALDRLGILADPTKLHEPIDISGCEPKQLIQHLKMMLIIRVVEEKIADMYIAGKIKCPCHLGIGQEAIAVGVSAALSSKTDKVFGAHRSHAHFLAVGGSVYSLFAEVLGKVTGCSKGMGGSMHLYDAEHGFGGSVPIVGASVPIAVGAALAAKKDGKGGVVVSYLGDSTLEEGAVQESLNLASQLKLPIVFVCENNLFASHMHISQRQPSDATIRFAHAHKLNAALVDGNDVVAVQRAFAKLAELARTSGKPAYLEAVTYRWRGHVGPSEDIDVGVQRKDNLDLWKQRDPIKRLVDSLIKVGAISQLDLSYLKQEVQEQIDCDWLRAEQDPYPDSSALLDLVYAQPKSPKIELTTNQSAQPSELTPTTYAQGILKAYQYLMSTDPNVFVFGQGLWSPWYVGASMTDLDKDYGIDRVIDSPVSEVAVTGAALGASLCGYRPIVVHPRLDFMILAIDQIVSQAANWSHMFGGQNHPALTIRGMINRGGEQGAQHSQALHAWFAHVPGLRVVMPSTPADARDLLIASVLSNDPVLYIDDRWLYELSEDLPPIQELDLNLQQPKLVQTGTDCTLVGSGYSTHLCRQAADLLREQNISCDVIDLRVINPLRYETIVQSVLKTGRLCVVDGGWSTCGLAGEIIAGVMEQVQPQALKSKPCRITLPTAPAPTSRVLEDIFYTKVEDIISKVTSIVK